jgi:hypothetical protein
VMTWPAERDSERPNGAAAVLLCSCRPMKCHGTVHVHDRDNRP